MRAKHSVLLANVFLGLCLLLGCASQQQEEGGSVEPAKVASSLASAAQPTAKADKASAEGYAKDVLPRYIDCAKTFSQMAIAALSLTIVFREKVLGGTGPMEVGRLLVASWSCFLVSIGAGLCYQWLAIRLISLKNGYETAYFPLTYGAMWPGNVFGLMLVAFFGGAVMLVITSAVQLRTQSSSRQGES